jgi:COMPASS component SWD2
MGFEASCLSGWLFQSIINLIWIIMITYLKGLMHLQGRPVANFDPEGLIFAAGISSDTIKLYDLRSFEKVDYRYFKIM